ncbi:MAG: V-type ATP synthase subunit A, partial [Kiritimatiellia bacterium]|nr:V-type ATP synthase subunit A [Kiritimatiellia bacterium]
ADRQIYVFGFLHKVLRQGMEFDGKEKARAFFQKLTQTVRDWNRAAMDGEEFKSLEKQIESQCAEVAKYA